MTGLFYPTTLKKIKCEIRIYHRIVVFIQAKTFDIFSREICSTFS
jgi:hypothetical protein